MVYKWAAAWAHRSAIPLLHDDEGKPLVESIGKEWDGRGAARDALLIPDLFYHYHKDAGYTVSMNSKTASILTRMDAAVGLTPHTVYWADGAVAERRYILTGFPNILPLDDKRSRYKRPNGWDAELHNTDDRFVFDCEKFRPHHIWRSRAISTSCFSPATL